MIGSMNMFNRFKFSMNPKSYINFINDRFKKAIIYLLIISTVVGIVESIKFVTIFSEIEESFEKTLKKDELEFEMVDGILNFKSRTFKDEEGQFLLLIDTDKSLKDIDSLRSITVHKEAVTVFLKDGFMLKSNKDKKIHTYSELGLDKINIDNNTLINLMSSFKFIKYIIIPIVIIGEFIIILIYALIVSLVGFLNVLFSRRKMSYKNIFKLSIYSLTLPIIINIILPVDRYIVLVGGFMIIMALNYINFYEDK